MTGNFYCPFTLLHLTGALRRRYLICSPYCPTDRLHGSTSYPRLATASPGFLLVHCAVKSPPITAHFVISKYILWRLRPPITTHSVISIFRTTNHSTPTQTHIYLPLTIPLPQSASPPRTGNNSTAALSSCCAITSTRLHGGNTSSR